MKNKVYFIFNLISIIMLAVLLCLSGVFGAISSTTVYAAESPEVLQDLRKDKDFNENEYPHVADDYSLKVIQIAESSNKELFVYAYQPCHDTYDLVGTKISISYGYSLNGADLTPKLYNLRLISTSGTLDKYYVQDFTIPNDGDRYYNIVEIFRMVNADIDEIDEAFPKTDIAYSVGQQWYVHDLNNTKLYDVGHFSVLPVETVFNGAVHLQSLLNVAWGGKFEECDVWFYCFTQDEYVIKHIEDARLSYSLQVVEEGKNNPVEHEPLINQVVDLKKTDTVNVKTDGVGWNTYEWNKILPTKQFVADLDKNHANLSSEAREKVLNSQWVFTFLETEYTEYVHGGEIIGATYSNVYDVGLLRLHFFDSRDKEYDLGIVNDLTDPDNKADGGTAEALRQEFEDFWEMFMKIVLTIIGVILLAVLLNFITPVANIFKFIVKAVVFVVAAPFKLLKNLFKKDG